MGRIGKALEHHVNGIKDKEKTLQDWKRQAIVYGIVCDLAKPLYIGGETDKMYFLLRLLRAAKKSGNSALMRKASDEMKELADKTGLEMMKDAAEASEKHIS